MAAYFLQGERLWSMGLEGGMLWERLVLGGIGLGEIGFRRGLVLRNSLWVAAVGMSLEI